LVYSPVFVADTYHITGVQSTGSQASFRGVYMTGSIHHGSFDASSRF
jgi:hypothetical protein